MIEAGLRLTSTFIATFNGSFKIVPAWKKRFGWVDLDFRVLGKGGLRE
jgi:hypothetical protein